MDNIDILQSFKKLPNLATDLVPFLALFIQHAVVPLNVTFRRNL